MAEYEYLKVSDGSGDAALMHITGTRLTGATTIEVDTVANVPDKFIGTYGTLGSNGLITPATKVDFTGHLDGADIVIDDFMPGNVDAGNTVGQVVIIKPNTIWSDTVGGFIENAKGFGTPENVEFDGVTADTVTAVTVGTTGDITEKGNTLTQMRKDTMADFIVSGGVWTGDAYGSTRNASMTALVCYINGQRGTIAAVTARAFTASKDTYIDVLNTAGVFTLVYTEVSNNAASPALAANSLRLGIVVTGASNIAATTSINQGQLDALLPTSSGYIIYVADTLGNRIYNTSPTGGILSYRQKDAALSAGNTNGNNIMPTPFIVPAGKRIKYTVFAKTGNFSTGQNSFFRVEGNLDSGTTLKPGVGWINGGTAQSNDTSAYAIAPYSPTAGYHTIGANMSMGGYQMAAVDVRILVELY